MANHLNFEPLTKFTPLQSFKCGRDPGDDDLAEFLAKDALDNQNKHISKTTLAYLDDNTLVGFFTLSCHTVELLPKEKKKYLLHTCKYKYLPAVLLARLAVHEEYRGLGIGTTLLATAVGQSLKVSDLVGCRFFVADVYDHRVSWYQKRGFIRIISEPEKGDNPVRIPMRLDLFSREENA